LYPTLPQEEKGAGGRENPEERAKYQRAKAEADAFALRLSGSDPGNNPHSRHRCGWSLRPLGVRVFENTLLQGGRLIAMTMLWEGLKERRPNEKSNVYEMMGSHPRFSPAGL